MAEVLEYKENDQEIKRNDIFEKITITCKQVLQLADDEILKEFKVSSEEVPVFLSEEEKSNILEVRNIIETIINDESLLSQCLRFDDFDRDSPFSEFRSN